MDFCKKWVRNHQKFLLHFLIHIDVLMLLVGCRGVEGQEERGGSLSVELVSRCALHNWLSVSTSLTDIHGDSTGRITLSQVLEISNN